jgi:hypothetical protein
MPARDIKKTDEICGLSLQISSVFYFLPFISAVLGFNTIAKAAGAVYS